MEEQNIQQVENDLLALTDEQLKERIDAAQTEKPQTDGVSVNDLLGGEEAQEEQEIAQPATAEEVKPDTVQPVGNIEDDPRWQPAVDRMIGKRLAAERRKIQDQFAEDKRIADIVRKQYEGKTAQEIESAIVAQMVEEAGLDPSNPRALSLFMDAVSRGNVAAEQPDEPEEPQAAKADDAIVQELSALSDRGLYVAGDLEKLGKEIPDLLAQLKSGKSLYEIAGKRLLEMRLDEATQKSVTAVRQRNNAPRPVGSGGATRKVDFANMSDADFEKVRERLRREGNVRVD